MKIGYARVSTADQHLRMQEDALKNAGCKKIYHDTASGIKADRSGLEKALEQLREGDVLVVWKLDRLGRSLRHLIDIIEQLHAKNIGFQSLRESIDTTTTGGKLVFHIFSALAEFERDLIRDRTNAGLQAARARGKKGGRPVQLAAKEVNKMIAYYRKVKIPLMKFAKSSVLGAPVFIIIYVKKRKLFKQGRHISM